MARQLKHFQRFAELFELRIGGNQGSAQAHRQFRGKTIRQTQLITNANRRGIQRNLIVHWHRLRYGTRNLDHPERFVLPKVPGKNAKYLRQVHNGNGQGNLPIFAL